MEQKYTGVCGMALTETMNHLNTLLNGLMKDLTKVHRGNKTAAQRVRVGTIQLEKIGKEFRKQSVAAEKSGKFKRPSQRKKRKKKR